MPIQGRFNLTLRALSLFLSLSLAVESLAFASPIPARGVFAKDEKARVELSVPASVATVEDAWFAPTRHSEARSAEESPRLGDSSLTSFAQNDGGGKLVYLLQDAHTNASAQFNMAELLKSLFETQSDLRTVFVEAGFGNDTLSAFRPFLPLADRRREAAAFVRQGYLGGEEYLSVVSDVDFTIWGVEDETLYEKAVESYRQTRASREKFKRFLDSAELTLSTLDSRVLNPVLLAFDAKRRAYAAGKLALTDYLDALESEVLRLGLSAEKGGELKKLSAVRAMERAIDFNQARAEQMRAVLSLPKEDQEELAGFNPGKLRAKEEGEAAFYARLEEKLGDKRGDYPQLFKYLDYRAQARALDLKKTLDEIGAMEARALDKLTLNAEEKTFLDARATADAWKKLFAFTMTPEEFAGYRARAKELSVVQTIGFLNRKVKELGSHYERALFLEEGFEEVVRIAESFYGLTLERDEVFVKNLTAKMDEAKMSRSVLITGGYHTQNLKNLLKSRNISFVSITPQVLHETNLKRYEEVLLGDAFAAKPALARSLAPRMTDNRHLADYPGAFELVGARLAPGLDAAGLEDLRLQIKTGARLGSQNRIESIAAQVRNAKGDEQAIQRIARAARGKGDITKDDLEKALKQGGVAGSKVKSLAAGARLVAQQPEHQREKAEMFDRITRGRPGVSVVMNDGEAVLVQAPEKPRVPAKIAETGSRLATLQTSGLSGTNIRDEEMIDVLTRVIQTARAAKQNEITLRLDRFVNIYDNSLIDRDVVSERVSIAHGTPRQKAAEWVSLMDQRSPSWRNDTYSLTWHGDSLQISPKRRRAVRAYPSADAVTKKTGETVRDVRHDNTLVYRVRYDRAGGWLSIGLFDIRYPEGVDVLRFQAPGLKDADLKRAANSLAALKVPSLELYRHDDLYESIIRSTMNAVGQGINRRGQKDFEKTYEFSSGDSGLAWGNYRWVTYTARYSASSGALVFLRAAGGTGHYGSSEPEEFFRIEKAPILDKAFYASLNDIFYEYENRRHPMSEENRVRALVFAVGHSGQTAKVAAGARLAEMTLTEFAQTAPSRGITINILKSNGQETGPVTFTGLVPGVRKGTIAALTYQSGPETASAFSPTGAFGETGRKTFFPAGGAGPRAQFRLENTEIGKIHLLGARLATAFVPVNYRNTNAKYGHFSVKRIGIRSTPLSSGYPTTEYLFEVATDAGDVFEVTGAAASGASAGVREALFLFDKKVAEDFNLVKDGIFKAIYGNSVNREEAIEQMLKDIFKDEFVSRKDAIAKMKADYDGKGVKVALWIAEKVILPKMKKAIESGKLDLADRYAVDRFLLALDQELGGEKYQKLALSGNNTTALTTAAIKLVAKLNGLSTAQVLSYGYDPKTRTVAPEQKFGIIHPLAVLIEGGAHGGWQTDWQEIMALMRLSSAERKLKGLAPQFEKMLEKLSNMMFALEKELVANGESTATGLEAAYLLAHARGNADAIHYLLKAAKKAGLEADKDFAIGLDLASSEFYHEADPKQGYEAAGYYYALEGRRGKKIEIMSPEGKAEDLGKLVIVKKPGERGEGKGYLYLTSEEQFKWAQYLVLVAKYPLGSLEDVFGEFDLKGNHALTQLLYRLKRESGFPFRFQNEEGVVHTSDDMTTSRRDLTEAGIMGGTITIGFGDNSETLSFDAETVDGELLKLNQIATVMEYMEQVEYLRARGRTITHSHRGQEPPTETIRAAVAVASTTYPTQAHDVIGTEPQIYIKYGTNRNIRSVVLQAILQEYERIDAAGARLAGIGEFNRRTIKKFDPRQFINLLKNNPSIKVSRLYGSALMAYVGNHIYVFDPEEDLSSLFIAKMSQNEAPNVMVKANHQTTLPGTAEIKELLAELENRAGARKAGLASTEERRTATIAALLTAKQTGSLGLYVNGKLAQIPIADVSIQWGTPKSWTSLALIAEQDLRAAWGGKESTDVEIRVSAGASTLADRFRDLLIVMNELTSARPAIGAEVRVDEQGSRGGLFSFRVPARANRQVRDLMVGIQQAGQPEGITVHFGSLHPLVSTTYTIEAPAAQFQTLKAIYEQVQTGARMAGARHPEARSAEGSPRVGDSSLAEPALNEVEGLAQNDGKASTSAGARLTIDPQKLANLTNQFMLTRDSHGIDLRRIYNNASSAGEAALDRGLMTADASGLTTEQFEAKLTGIFITSVQQTKAEFQRLYEKALEEKGVEAKTAASAARRITEITYARVDALAVQPETSLDPAPIWRVLGEISSFVGEMVLDGSNIPADAIADMHDFMAGKLSLSEAEKSINALEPNFGHEEGEHYVRAMLLAAKTTADMDWSFPIAFSLLTHLNGPVANSLDIVVGVVQKAAADSNEAEVRRVLEAAFAQMSAGARLTGVSRRNLLGAGAALIPFVPQILEGQVTRSESRQAIVMTEAEIKQRIGEISLEAKDQFDFEFRSANRRPALRVTPKARRNAAFTAENVINFVYEKGAVYVRSSDRYSRISNQGETSEIDKAVLVNSLSLPSLTEILTLRDDAMNRQISALYRSPGFRSSRRGADLFSYPTGFVVMTPIDERGTPSYDTVSYVTGVTAEKNVYYVEFLGQHTNIGPAGFIDRKNANPEAPSSASPKYLRAPQGQRAVVVDVSELPSDVKYFFDRSGARLTALPLPVVKPALLKGLPKLFEMKNINGRDLNPLEVIAALEAQMTGRPEALVARRKHLEDKRPVREKYAFAKWDERFEDADGSVRTFREIVQGMIDNFLGVESDLRWRLNDEVPIPDEINPLSRPGLQITGPSDPLDMAINQMNAIVQVRMPDTEDASAAWYTIFGSPDDVPGVYKGLQNEAELLSGEWDVKTYTVVKKGVTREYRIIKRREDRPVSIERSPSIHLTDDHITINGKPVSAKAIVYALHTLNTHGALKKNDSGNYFYEPKIQTPAEALIPEKGLKELENLIGLKRGTIKIEMLYEEGNAGRTLPAIFWVWRHRLIGSNVGRWDYIGSLIEMWKDEGVFPDPQGINMFSPNLVAYQRFNALLNLMAGMKDGKLTNAAPIGGMAAVMLYPMNDPYGRWRNNAKALRSMFLDKMRERLIGLIYVPDDPDSKEQPTLAQILKDIENGTAKGRLFDTYRQSWVATPDKDYVAAGNIPLQTELKELQALLDAVVEWEQIDGKDVAPKVSSGLTAGEREMFQKHNLLNAEGQITPWVVAANKFNTPEKLLSQELWDSLYSIPKGEITIERIQHAFYMAAQYGFQILNANYAAAIDDYELGLRFMNDLATYRIFVNQLWAAFHHNAKLTKGGWLKAPVLDSNLGVIPGENSIFIEGDKPLSPEIFGQMWGLHDQWVKAFFAEQDRRGEPARFNRDEAGTIMDVLKRQLLSPRFLQHSPRVLFVLAQASEKEREQIKDAIFSDSREAAIQLLNDRVKEGLTDLATAQKALTAHDYVFDYFPEVEADIPSVETALVGARLAKIDMESLEARIRELVPGSTGHQWTPILLTAFIGGAELVGVVPSETHKIFVFRGNRQELMVAVNNTALNLGYRSMILFWPNGKSGGYSNKIYEQDLDRYGAGISIRDSQDLYDLLEGMEQPLRASYQPDEGLFGYIHQRLADRLFDIHGARLALYSFSTDGIPDFEKIERETYGLRELPADAVEVYAPHKDAMANPQAGSITREYDLRGEREVFTPAVTEAFIAAQVVMGYQMGERNNRIAVVAADQEDYNQEGVEIALKEYVRAGYEVIYVNRPITSPLAYMLALFTGADNITFFSASHNPYGDKGLKVGIKKGTTFGPFGTRTVTEIARQGLRVKDAPVKGRVTTLDFDGLKDALAYYHKLHADNLGISLDPNRFHLVVNPIGGTAGFDPQGNSSLVSLLASNGFQPASYEFMDGQMHSSRDIPGGKQPNPELGWVKALLQPHLRDIASSHEGKILLGMAFDRDADRQTLLDDQAQSSADKLGVLAIRQMAANYRRLHPGDDRKIVVYADMKSSLLVFADPELKALNVEVRPSKTGHSYLKWHLRESGKNTDEITLAAFEQSGHSFWRTNPADPQSDVVEDPMAFIFSVMQYLQEHNITLAQALNTTAPYLVGPSTKLYFDPAKFAPNGRYPTLSARKYAFMEGSLLYLKSLVSQTVAGKYVLVGVEEISGTNFRLFFSDPAQTKLLGSVTFRPSSNEEVLTINIDAAQAEGLDPEQFLKDIQNFVVLDLGAARAVELTTMETKPGQKVGVLNPVEQTAQEVFAYASANGWKKTGEAADGSITIRHKRSGSTVVIPSGARLAGIDPANLPKTSVVRLFSQDPAAPSNEFMLDGFPKPNPGETWQEALKRFIEQMGALDMTSNQVLIDQLIQSGAMDARLLELKGEGKSAEEIYQILYSEAAQEASSIFSRIHNEWPGQDAGRVSQEASALITDKDALVAAAKGIDAGFKTQTGHFTKVPNIRGSFTKVPNISVGPQAVAEAIRAGVDVNVTLVFNVKHYLDNAEAYILGLEQRMEDGNPIGSVRSVSSLFVSRIDTVVDQRIDNQLAQTADDDERSWLQLLRGKTAVAQGQLIYQMYKAIFLGEEFAGRDAIVDVSSRIRIDNLRRRFNALREDGAKPQRLLIASSGVKSEEYHPLLYVLPFMGRHVLNTLPQGTFEKLSAFVAMLTDAQAEDLRTRSLISEGIPSIAQTKGSIAQWQEILLSRRSAEKISPETVLRKLEELVLKPQGTTLEAIGDERRDAGAKDFENTEMKTVATIRQRMGSRLTAFRDLGDRRGINWWSSMEEGRRKLLVRYLGTSDTEPLITIPFDHHKPQGHYSHVFDTANPTDPTKNMLLIAQNMQGYVDSFLIHPGYLLGRRNKTTNIFVNLKALSTMDKDQIARDFGKIELHPDLPKDKAYVLKWEGESTPNGEEGKPAMEIGKRPTNQGEELNITASDISQVQEVIGLKFMTYVDSSKPETFNAIAQEIQNQSALTHAAGLLYFPENLPAKVAIADKAQKARWEAQNTLLFAKMLSDNGIDYDAYKYGFPGEFGLMSDDEIEANLRQVADYTRGRFVMMLSGGDASTLVNKARWSARLLNYVGGFMGRGIWQKSFTSVAADDADRIAKISANLSSGDAKAQFDSVHAVKLLTPWWNYIGADEAEVRALGARLNAADVDTALERVKPWRFRQSWNYDLAVHPNVKISAYPDLSRLTVNAVLALYQSGWIGRGDKDALDAIATRVHRETLQAIADELKVGFVVVNSEGLKDFGDAGDNRYYLEQGETILPRSGAAARIFQISNDSLDGTGNTSKYDLSNPTTEGRATSIAVIGREVIPVPDQMRAFSLIYNDGGKKIRFEFPNDGRTLEQALVDFIVNDYAPKMSLKPSDVTLEIMGKELTSAKPHRHRALYDLAKARGIRVPTYASGTVTPGLHAALTPGRIYAQIAGSTETFSAAQAAANLWFAGAQAYVKLASINAFDDVEADPDHAGFFKSTAVRARNDMANLSAFAKTEEALLRERVKPGTTKPYFSEDDIRLILKGEKAWSIADGTLPAVAISVSFLLPSGFRIPLNRYTIFADQGLEAGDERRTIFTLLIDERGAVIRETSFQEGARLTQQAPNWAQAFAPEIAQIEAARAEFPEADEDVRHMLSSAVQAITNGDFDGAQDIVSRFADVTPTLFVASAMLKLKLFLRANLNNATQITIRGVSGREVDSEMGKFFWSFPVDRRPFVHPDPSSDKIVITRQAGSHGWADILTTALSGKVYSVELSEGKADITVGPSDARLAPFEVGEAELGYVVVNGVGVPLMTPRQAARDLSASIPERVQVEITPSAERPNSIVIDDKLEPSTSFSLERPDLIAGALNQIGGIGSVSDRKAKVPTLFFGGHTLYLAGKISADRKRAALAEEGLLAGLEALKERGAIQPRSVSLWVSEPDGAALLGVRIEDALGNSHEVNVDSSKPQELADTLEHLVSVELPEASRRADAFIELLTSRAWRGTHTIYETRGDDYDVPSSEVPVSSAPVQIGVVLEGRDLKVYDRANGAQPLKTISRTQTPSGILRALQMLPSGYALDLGEAAVLEEAAGARLTGEASVIPSLLKTVFEEHAFIVDRFMERSAPLGHDPVFSVEGDALLFRRDGYAIEINRKPRLESGPGVSITFSTAPNANFTAEDYRTIRSTIFNLRTLSTGDESGWVAVSDRPGDPLQVDLALKSWRGGRWVIQYGSLQRKVGARLAIDFNEIEDQIREKIGAYKPFGVQELAQAFGLEWPVAPHVALEELFRASDRIAKRIDSKGNVHYLYTPIALAVQVGPDAKPEDVPYASTVVINHSETREFLGSTAEKARAQMDAFLAAGFKVILAFGDFPPALNGADYVAKGLRYFPAALSGIEEKYREARNDGSPRFNALRDLYGEALSAESAAAISDLSRDWPETVSALGITDATPLSEAKIKVIAELSTRAEIEQEVRILFTGLDPAVAQTLIRKAYEPVESIRTTPISKELAKHRAGYIKAAIAEATGLQAGDVRLIYGGGANVNTIAAFEDYDGAFIGRASAKANAGDGQDSTATIAKAALASATPLTAIFNAKSAETATPAEYIEGYRARGLIGPDGTVHQGVQIIHAVLPLQYSDFFSAFARELDPAQKSVAVVAQEESAAAQEKVSVGVVADRGTATQPVGAFTAHTPAKFLKGKGVTHVILNHENPAFLAQAENLIAAGVVPVVAYRGPEAPKGLYTAIHKIARTQTGDAVMVAEIFDNLRSLASDQTFQVTHADPVTVLVNVRADEMLGVQHAIAQASQRNITLIPVFPMHEAREAVLALGARLAGVNAGDYYLPLSESYANTGILIRVVDVSGDRVTVEETSYSTGATIAAPASRTIPFETKGAFWEFVEARRARIFNLSVQKSLANLQEAAAALPAEGPSALFYNEMNQGGVAVLVFTAPTATTNPNSVLEFENREIKEVKISRGFDRESNFLVRAVSGLYAENQAAARRKAEADSAPIDETIRKTVYRVIVEQLGVNDAQVALDSKFAIDLGATSLEMIDLIMAFEEAFTIDISDEQAQQLATVRDAIALIQKLRGARLTTVHSPKEAAAEVLGFLKKNSANEAFVFLREFPKEVAAAFTNLAPVVGGQVSTEGTISGVVLALKKPAGADEGVYADVVLNALDIYKHESHLYIAVQADGNRLTLTLRKQDGRPIWRPEGSRRRPELGARLAKTQKILESLDAVDLQVQYDTALSQIRSSIAIGQFAYASTQITNLIRTLNDRRVGQRSEPIAQLKKVQRMLSGARLARAERGDVFRRDEGAVIVYDGNSDEVRYRAIGGDSGRAGKIESASASAFHNLWQREGFGLITNDVRRLAAILSRVDRRLLDQDETIYLNDVHYYDLIAPDELRKNAKRDGYSLLALGNGKRVERFQVTRTKPIYKDSTAVHLKHEQGKLVISDEMYRAFGKQQPRWYLLTLAEAALYLLNNPDQDPLKAGVSAGARLATTQEIVDSLRSIKRGVPVQYSADLEHAIRSVSNRQYSMARSLILDVIEDLERFSFMEKARELREVEKSLSSGARLATLEQSIRQIEERIAAIDRGREVGEEPGFAAEGVETTLERSALAATLEELRTKQLHKDIDAAARALSLGERTRGARLSKLLVKVPDTIAGARILTTVKFAEETPAAAVSNEVFFSQVIQELVALGETRLLPLQDGDRFEVFALTHQPGSFVVVRTSDEFQWTYSKAQGLEEAKRQHAQNELVREEALTDALNKRLAVLRAVPAVTADVQTPRLVVVYLAEQDKIQMTGALLDLAKRQTDNVSIYLAGSAQTIKTAQAVIRTQALRMETVWSKDLEAVPSKSVLADVSGLGALDSDSRFKDLPTIAYDPQNTGDEVGLLTMDVFLTIADQIALGKLDEAYENYVAARGSSEAAVSKDDFFAMVKGIKRELRALFPLTPYKMLAKELARQLWQRHQVDIMA